MGEFDYRSPKNFAEGGEVEAMDVAMDAVIGGMMKEGMNDKVIVAL